MKNEFTYLSKKKINWMIYVFIFVNILFIEMSYVYLASPIGIFHGENIDSGVAIMNVCNAVLGDKSVTGSKLISDFNSTYKNNADAISMLSAHTIDRITSIFYMLSIVLGAMIIRKADFTKLSKQSFLGTAESIQLVIKRYVVNVLYTTVVLAVILIIPFICLVRMKGMGYAGSPMQLYILFLKWTVPTICIAYALQLFVTVLSKEPVLTYLVHAISLPIMLSYKENKYPFYQFVIRAGEYNHKYYLSYAKNIAINRICMIVFSVLLLIGASIHLSKKYTKAS